MKETVSEVDETLSASLLLSLMKLNKPSKVLLRPRCVVMTAAP